MPKFTNFKPDAISITDEEVRVTFGPETASITKAEWDEVVDGAIPHEHQIRNMAMACNIQGLLSDDRDSCEQFVAARFFKG